MFIFQEFSGHTFFELAQNEFDLVNCPLWNELDYLVLINCLTLVDGQIVFKKAPYLFNIETYWGAIKHKSVVIEIPTINCDNTQLTLDGIKKFISQHPNVVGLKMTLKGGFDLRSMQHLEQFMAKNSLMIIMNVPKHSIWLQKQLSYADFVVCSNQGYFEKNYVNEIYGVLFERLVVKSDRSIKQIIKGIKEIEAVGDKPRILLDIATSGIKYGACPNEVIEIPRKACFQNSNINAPIFWDTCLTIYEKLKLFTAKYQIRGVYLQDLLYDYSWREPKSILQCCSYFKKDPNAYTPAALGDKSFDINGTLQAPPFFPKLQYKTISKAKNMKKQEEK